MTWHGSSGYTPGRPGDLALFEEQAAKWGRLPALSWSRRGRLRTLNEQLGELRELNREVLALVDELAKGTMDTVMAALDEELGPTALLGTGPGVRGGEKGAGGGAGRVDGAPA